MGRKRKKKFKAQHRPKQPKAATPELSGKDIKIAKIRASIDKLEREYKQGRATKVIYGQLKAEYETKIRKLEQPSFFEKVSIYNILLILILALAFYIRAILPQGSVFIGDIVRFGGNDPWYHMRLVENTIHNFPHRIMFDPFTNFPVGNSLHFGPLFDQTVAFLALLVGFGSPSQHTIEVVGAYFPAALGTLVVIPVYVIGREIFDKRVGIFSALLVAIMPGQFLSRSVLGFTDHHVAETLFSTLTIMFFIIAIKRAGKQELTFEHLLKKNWKVLKSPVIYSTLAGFMLGCYLLCWVGALLFAFVIAVYVALQCIVDHMRGKSLDYLCVVGAITFVMPLIMILPCVESRFGFATFRYSWLHVSVFTLGILAFLVLSGISKEANRRNLERIYYPLTLIGVGTLGLAAIGLVAPTLLNTMLNSFNVFRPTGGALTIAEVSSIFYKGGQFTLETVWYNFTTCFYVAVIALLMVGYRVIKEWRPEDMLLVVWSAIMLFATIGQNRFAYYFVVNVAILSGYFGVKMLEWGGLGKLHENFKRRVTDASDVGYFVSRYVKLGHVLAVVLVILLLVYPNAAITMGSGPGAAKWTGGPNMDWYNSLDWMRYNTPDPGLDYYALYEAPAPGEAYQYPDSAYGVMSWWDYGHWITRIAHRIPNANPFQSGIGGPGPNDTIVPGACMFFTATDESTANWILDELGTKYVVIDIEMATGKFWAMGTFAAGGDVNKYWAKYQVVLPDGSAGWGPEYYKTMIVRLHFFNGENYTSPYGDQIEPLEHYRLVYESPTTVGTIEGREIRYVKIFEYVP
ncbi:MAG: oligosaccharyl transferase, archaeosortase A system-associated [Methanosarcinales archaeon]|nr:MAG: oligosaccharyl transferase, archaeosortase A system-associated [Methanosarcinales archaeon]